MSALSASRNLQIILGSRYDATLAEKLHALARDGGMHWAAIFGLADRNQMASLVYETLQRAGLRNVVPEKDWHAISRLHRNAGLRNLHLLARLKEALIRLQGEGIQVVVMKGMALLETIWKNPALRSMSDIDLLVRRHDAEAAEKMFWNEGYRSVLKCHDRDWYQTRHHHLPPLFHPRDHLIVELHLDILPDDMPVRVDIDRFWERAEPLEIAGTQSMKFCDEDLLAHTCLHHGLSAYSGIGHARNLLDIAELLRLRGQTLDWSRISDEAAEFGWGGFFFIPLRFAADFFKAPIPPEILKRFEEISGFKPVRTGILKSMADKNVFLSESNRMIPLWVYEFAAGEILKNRAWYKTWRAFFSSFRNRVASDYYGDPMKAAPDGAMPFVRALIRKMSAGLKRFIARKIAGTT